MVLSPPISVAGETVNSGELDVTSPWDGTVVGSVSTVGADGTKAAIEAAHHAMETGLPAHVRAEILERSAQELKGRREDFARTLALEIGKPIAQALVEVDRCVQTLLFSAAEARTLTGTGVAFDAHPAGVHHRGYTLRVPVGVVGAITPFNFPLNLAAHKVGPAIAAGCGVVLKPSREAPIAAAQFANVLYDSGLPRSWLSVVVGDAGEIVDQLVTDDRVGMLTFTGSSEVGWNLAARAPKKRVRLELGNSTPVIVCSDADLRAAAESVTSSAFGFAGQSCISVQRVIVESTVYDEFVDLVAGETANRKVGNPLDRDTHVGPLINRTAHDRVVDWIEEAKDHGASAATDSTHTDQLIQPVVLANVDRSSRIWRDEAFGPVMGLRSFATFDEAIELANETEFGLQAGIFTRDLSTALEASERLDFGGVTINETPTFRVDQMPYGGTKSSGNTREGPHYTVRDMTEERVIVIGK